MFNEYINKRVLVCPERGASRATQSIAPLGHWWHVTASTLRYAILPGITLLYYRAFVRTRVASFGPRIGDTETESRKRSSIARFFDVFSTLVDLVDPISRLHIATGVVKMADKRSINEENNGEFFFCEITGLQKIEYFFFWKFWSTFGL